MLIVIDTNIFEHLLNSDINIKCLNPLKNRQEKHINQLLKKFRKERQLCVDKGGRILNEYKYRLQQAIKDAVDERDEIQLLRYWIFEHEHYECERTNRTFDQRIRRIIVDKKGTPQATDCVFISKAALNECHLITNDSEHVRSRAEQVYVLIQQLLNHQNTEIYTSIEAYEVYIALPSGTSFSESSDGEEV